MRLLLVIVALLVFLSSPQAYAQAATLTIAWDAYPVDQLPLIQGFNLYRSMVPCAQTPVAPIPTKVGSVLNNTAVTMADTIAVNATVCYELTAFGPGGESIRSNRAEGVVRLSPNRPGNVRIVVTVTP